jgi:hypothetical protein
MNKIVWAKKAVTGKGLNRCTDEYSKWKHLYKYSLIFLELLKYQQLQLHRTFRQL